MSDLRDVARFEARLSLGPGGCWIWTGSLTGGGYPQMYCVETNRTVRAYAWAYEHHRAPVPAGLHLDHLCRTTACVNPWHLEPVPHRENSRRRDMSMGRTV